MSRYSAEGAAEGCWHWAAGLRISRGVETQGTSLASAYPIIWHIFNVTD